MVLSPATRKWFDAGNQPGGGDGHLDDCGAFWLRSCQPAVLVPVSVCKACGAL